MRVGSSLVRTEDHFEKSKTLHIKFNTIFLTADPMSSDPMVCVAFQSVPIIPTPLFIDHGCSFVRLVDHFLPANLTAGYTERQALCFSLAKLNSQVKVEWPASR